MTVRMKQAHYSRPRMGVADFEPPKQHVRPSSWGPEGGGGNRGVSGRSSNVPGPRRVDPRTSAGKMIDLSPDEYSWMPERQRLPKTARERRRFFARARAVMNDAKLFARFAPWVRAVRTAMDIYDMYNWVRRLEQMPTVEFTGNPTCSSYKASIDLPTPSCGYGYHLSTANVAAGQCSTWHYQNQALNPIISGHTAWVYGPLRGGIYACQRFNLAYVVRYASGAVRAANPPIIRPYSPARTSLNPTPFIYPDLVQEQGYGAPRADRPQPLPYESPSMSFRPPPRGTPTWFPDYHGHLPPPRKRDEKKGRLPVHPALSKGVKVYGMATEAGDFLDAMYAGVPKNKQRRWHGPLDKAKAIYDNWDDWDWRAAMKEFGRQQMMDKFIGKANKVANDALTRQQYYRSPVGLGAGGWATRRATRLPMVKMNNGKE